MSATMIVSPGAPLLGVPARRGRCVACQDSSPFVWPSPRPPGHNPGIMSGILRSLLFVPGHRARFYEKLAEFRPDAVIVDLEDAVPPNEKSLARTMVRERLGGPLFAALMVFVRVNAVDSPYFRDDVREVVADGLDGIFLPKAATPEQLHVANMQLAQTEMRIGMTMGTTRIVPI